MTAWPSGLLLLAVLGLSHADGRCHGGGCAASASSLLAVKAETRAVSTDDLSDLPIDLTEGAGNGTNGTKNGTNTTLEDILLKNLEHDLKEASKIPDPENSTNGTQGKHGFGQLGANLEFMMLKLAQLETVVELQQVEIHRLNEWKRSHLAGEHNISEPSLSAAEMKAKEERGTREAHETLKKVLHKHNHQREKREFVAPKPSHGEERQKGMHVKHGQSAGKERSELLQGLSQRQGHQRQGRHLDVSVSSKVPLVDDVVPFVEDAVTDGTGMIGDALGDAYENAADQVSFVANTVIDTVEMAVDILVRGFTDWSAGCPDTRTPDMTVDLNGIHVDWGRQSCWVSLMGQTCDLFDFDFGSTSLSWPEPLNTVTSFGILPIKSMFNLGAAFQDCAPAGSAPEVIQCLGMRLLGDVEPLNFLTRMGDMLTEFIEVFAQVAGVVVEQAMSDGASLIQQATQSRFPDAGQAPVVHHAGKSLTIKTHSQHRKHTPRSKLPRQEMSAVLLDARRGDDDQDPEGSIALGVSDQEGNYATRLITQWNGRETDTSSCLAFAPKNKHGSNNQATKEDWQGNSGDDFIPLEPFGVPCDNDWMKANWDKWQGYSFYTWEMSIEKCVTVTYSLGMQPVIAFVGGMNIELMPAPLAELDTTVCWPDKQPGGVDLSVLRSEFRSAGVMLFSRTLRLQKRFGSGTDFVDGNTFGAHETWRNPLGTAVGSHGVEDDRTVETMDRSLLETNQSSQGDPKKKRTSPETHELQWEIDHEDLYLATGEYGKHLGINKTSELRGREVLKALKRMKAMSSLQAEAESGTDFHQLFSFKNPGMISFEIQGLLEDNWLELGMKLKFGPFESPQKRIKLLSIVDQFTVVLGVMPWVSPSSKVKAIASLRDFGKNDMGAVTSEVLPDVTPGSIISIYSPTRNRWLTMTDQADMTRSPHRGWDEPFPDGWTWQKFAVVDAGSGLIALYSLKWNRFLSVGPDGDAYASPPKSASHFPIGKWTYQSFKVVYAGNGQVAFHCPIHNRFLRMTTNSVDAAGQRNADDLPADWTSERFRVRPTTWLLKPGTVVAFHNTINNRYISMDGTGQLYPSPARDFDLEFPSDWTFQKFTVVDAGNGEVALHNARHNRFWKMDDVNMVGSVPTATHDLPPPNEWPLERFAVVDVNFDGGQIALYNPHHNRMVSLSSTEVYSSPHRQPQDFPEDQWTYQQFRVKIVADFSTEANDLAWSYSS